MCALGRRCGPGDYELDFKEPPFSDQELERAATLRAIVSPDVRATKRRDKCPHAAKCETWETCVEKIAWYLRYQREIEAMESDT